jgi:ADP-ribosylation factor-like protein 6
MGFLTRIGEALGLINSEARVLVVGLDNSGKTTLINHLKAPGAASSVDEVTPTVGFQMEAFSQGNINFNVYDMSGQSRYRTLWEHYYSDVQAIIFVLDSTDKLRMCVAQEELNTLLAHNDIKRSLCPMLFFANKTDSMDALTPAECMEAMGLFNIRDRPWHMTASNAITGSGVPGGIEWLSEEIRSGNKSRK